MIVVTGATGRTGRRVKEVLLAKGEKVRVVGRDAKKLASPAQPGAEPFVRNAVREYTPDSDIGLGGSVPESHPFPHRPDSSKRFLIRLGSVLFFAAAFIEVTSGQLAAQVTTSVLSLEPQADPAATLARVTSLRDAFVEKIKSAGLVCPLAPPTIVLDDVPSFGSYDDTTNILHTSEWTKLTREEKSLFFTLAGPGADEQAAYAIFEEGTHRWVFVHELGHWWQACNRAIVGRSHYQAEYGANRIALAYWRETDPAFVNKMDALFQGTLNHLPNPVPQGQTIVEYFNDNYDSLGPTPAYRWFQSRMIVTAEEEEPHPTFAQALILPKQ